MKNKITSVIFCTDIDEYPDLSYLDQYKNSTNEEEQGYFILDQQRKEDYNNGLWNMLKVYAKAEINIFSDDEKTASIHYITSPGIYGVESDQDLKEYKEEQFLELKDILIKLNCDVENFEELIK